MESVTTLRAGGTLETHKTNMGWVKIGSETVRESTLNRVIAPPVCVAIGIGAYYASLELQDAYDFLRHGGSPEDLSMYPFVSMLSHDAIEKYVIDLPLIISVFSIVSFPGIVLPSLLARASRLRAEERLAERAPHV